MRAVVWLERGLEGAISPFRGEIPVVLGESERKVAERAAATDETARTMGEELHKSPRTIENQRRTTYAKLGISGRGDLSRLFDGYEPSDTTAP